MDSAIDYIFNKKIDLVLLDWLLPKKEGIELIKELNTQDIDLKIIMLTAKDTKEDEILALTKGADDYIRKPFEPEILILRIKKLLRYNDLLKYKELTLNIKENILLKNDEKIELTKKEYGLIKLFLSNKGVIL